MKQLNKILFGLTVFILLITNVNAQVINENANTYTEDKFIIGSTRFDNSEIITADKVILATQNQTKLNVALGMPITEAISKKVPVYSYSHFFEEWYVQEDGKSTLITNEDQIEELESNLNIFFINNVEKTIEIPYEGDVTSATNGVIYENGKFIVPATAITFEFVEDGESKVVSTATQVGNGEKLNYGSYDIVEKNNIVATVGKVSFDNIENALKASTKNQAAVLQKDITVNNIITLDGVNTYNKLDLGGHTLTSTAAEVIMISGVNNTLEITNGNIVSSNGATLYVGSKAQDNAYNKLIVNKNVKITAEYYGIYLVGDKSELDFDGELVVTGEANAISGNGNAVSANTIITIGENAKVTSTDFALYLPQAGTVTINGGTFEANTVIGIKAGTLTINGGTFKATGAKVSPEGNNNGINPTGDVIYIEENIDYADNIKITVADEAEFISANGYLIHEYIHSGNNTSEVTGKYATVHKLEGEKLEVYYTDTKDAAFSMGAYNFTEEYLIEALNASTNETPVTLLKDITVNEIITLNQENAYNVLNLGGHTLTSTADEVIKINGVNNTLKITNGNIVSSNGATLYVGSKAQDGAYNKLIVNKDVKITAENYGIYIVGDKSELDFDGELVVTGEANAISGNGNAVSANTIITIGENAKVTSTDFALYLPQAGTVTINGGTFEANTVIGIKAGTLTINGGTFKATGAKVSPEGNNNGINVTGDVIIVEENIDYADNIKITVADEAEFISANGYPIQEYLYSGENRATVTGKYSVSNKIETGYYYTDIALAQAKVNGVYYNNLQEALNNAKNGETVTILNNIAYENCETAPLLYQAEDTNISAKIDLNGKTVSATLVNGKSVQLIKVGNVNPDRKAGTATLTIEDSSTNKTGTLTVMPTVDSDGWYVSVSTISVERLGRLIVNSGRIITQGSEEQGGGNPYAIDVLTNTGAQTAELTINGGYIESKAKTGMGIRLFANSSRAAIILEVNGGEIVGSADGRGIWFQQSGGATYNLIEATLNGGKVKADRALEVGDFNLDEVVKENIQITINGGEFISTNNGGNATHEECDVLYTGKNASYYNQTFNHVKVVDNR